MSHQESPGCPLNATHRKLLWKKIQSCVAGVDCLQGLSEDLDCLDLSSPSFFIAKCTGSVLTLYMDEVISFPFSALIGIRVKNVRFFFFSPRILLRILLLACFFFFFFCLNETALVVCYEKKKANNPSPNNRAEL